MERSLDSLEKMAGELGATVVILREIAVPRGVVANSPLTDPGPDYSRSTSTSGSNGSGDELEAFSLELDGEDAKSTWHPTRLLRPHKSGRREKAEHKKVRRAVKRTVNAAFATTRVSPGLDVPQVVVSSVVPPVEVIPPLDVAVPFESTQPVKSSDPEEVIIVEALVVRKLALEEAFLDFGGFSVLG
ncbi:hypothetical protein ACGC1H_005845 [Rhizoctonia solani]